MPGSSWGNLLAGEDGRRSEVRAQTAGLHREWKVARRGATDRFVNHHCGSAFFCFVRLLDLRQCGLDVFDGNIRSGFGAEPQENGVRRTK